MDYKSRYFIAGLIIIGGIVLFFLRINHSSQNKSDMAPRQDAGKQDKGNNSASGKERIEALLADSKKHPDDSMKQIRLAEMYIMQGAYTQSENILDTVLKQEPQNTFALRVMGILKKSRKEYAEAEKFFQQAAEFGDPQNKGWAFLQLGMMHNDMGDKKRALQELRKAAQFNPDSQEIKAALKTV